jgi:hypothetical protein
MKVYISKYPENTLESRKVDIKVNSHDIVNMDQTLSLIIHAMLVKFFNCSKGCVPDGLKEIAWNQTLQTMIKAFELLSRDHDHLTTAERECVNSGLDLFSKHYMDLWY